MGGDRQIGGQGPGSGGPDDEGDPLSGKRGPALGEIAYGVEGDVDRRAGVVLVFDLSLRQGGVVGEAPVHRLLLAIEGAFAREGGELADLLRLVVEGKGQVRLFPTPEDSHPLELFPLDVYELERVLATPRQKLVAGKVAPVDLLLLEPLLHRQLDGKTMAVPTRDVVAQPAAQVLVFDDDVFEDLVDAVPGMKVPVRVRRAVVIDEFFRGGVLRQDLAVDAILIPPPQKPGLELGQVPLHREIGPRKIEGVFVLSFWGWNFGVVHPPVRLTRGIRRFNQGCGLKDDSFALQRPGRELILLRQAFDRFSV